MVGPYAGGPSTNGSGYQQRYDSAGPQSSYDSRGAISTRNMPPSNLTPLQMDQSAYNTGRPDPSKIVLAPRQQNSLGYPLADPAARGPPPQDYNGPTALGRPSEERTKSSTNGTRRPSGSRICGKCGEPLAGQFVRALDNTFHLDCFTCHVSLQRPRANLRQLI
jgi:hypothetical protein